jgi:hypothetical protein
MAARSDVHRARRNHVLASLDLIGISAFERGAHCTVHKTPRSASSAISRSCRAFSTSGSARANRRYRRPYLLMPEIPLIQRCQIGDFIGSSLGRLLPTCDFGQPSHQGKSKAQNSSREQTPVMVAMRQENGAGVGSSMMHLTKFHYCRWNFLARRVPDSMVKIAHSSK